MNKRHTMKTYGGVEVYTHMFLTLALVVEWSASRSVHFTFWWEAPEPVWTTWRGEKMFLLRLEIRSFGHPAFSHRVKIKVGLWDHLAVCVCLYAYPTFSSSECLNKIYETRYVYHGTWAHLKSVLHESLLQSVRLYVYSPLSLLGNGSGTC
jgi:hypothetical protein